MYIWVAIQATQNLIVLAREHAGADEIFKAGGVANLIHVIETSQDSSLKVNAIRVLACLCKDSNPRVCC